MQDNARELLEDLGCDPVTVDLVAHVAAVTSATVERRAVPDEVVLRASPRSGVAVYVSRSALVVAARPEVADGLTHVPDALQAPCGTVTYVRAPLLDLERAAALELARLAVEGLQHLPQGQRWHDGEAALDELALAVRLAAADPYWAAVKDVLESFLPGRNERPADDLPDPVQTSVDHLLGMISAAGSVELNPFAGMLEAPVQIGELYSEHGAGLREAANAYADHAHELAVGLLRLRHPGIDGWHVPWAKLQRRGIAPPPPKPADDDFW